MHVSCARRGTLHIHPLVGGGPCGLATAIALNLARPTLNICVFERDDLGPKGASIQISKSGWTALKAIDRVVSRRIRRETGTPVTGVRLMDFDGKTNQLPRPAQVPNINISNPYLDCCQARPKHPTINPPNQPPTHPRPTPYSV